MVDELLADEATRVVLLKRRGRYFAYVEGLAIHGDGVSPREALAAAERRYQELRSFAAAAGLPLATVALADFMSARRGRFAPLRSSS